MSTQAVYGVWCYDAQSGSGGRGDWLRESRADGLGVIAFYSLRMAQRRAAQEYGYPSYTAAKRHGWCEIRFLATGNAA